MCGYSFIYSVTIACIQDSENQKSSVQLFGRLCGADGRNSGLATGRWLVQFLVV